MDQPVHARDKSSVDDVENPRIAIPKEIQNEAVHQKQMFMVFFDARGVILAHAVHQGQTVDAAYYTKVSWNILPVIHVVSR